MNLVLVAVHGPPRPLVGIPLVGVSERFPVSARGRARVRLVRAPRELTMALVGHTRHDAAIHGAGGTKGDIVRRVHLGRSGRLSAGTASAIIVAAALGIAGCGQQQSPQASSPSESASPVPTSSSVELDAVGSPPEGAFTDSVGTDVTNVASIATDQGSVPGDTAGLYAAPTGPAPCDRNGLITRLHADGGRESAWAAARGIQAADIAGHINSLTPAIVRADTVLTDYRYENGRGTPHGIVLQAGAAILVDDHGLPAARCLSGDPLGPPPHWNTAPSFEGHQWTGFRPTALWVVEAAHTVVPHFEMCDAHYRGDPRNADYFTVDRGNNWAPHPLPRGQRPAPITSKHDWSWSADQGPNGDQHQNGEQQHGNGVQPGNQQPNGTGQDKGGHNQPDQQQPANREQPGNEQSNGAGQNKGGHNLPDQHPGQAGNLGVTGNQGSAGHSPTPQGESPGQHQSPPSSAVHPEGANPSAPRN